MTRAADDIVRWIQARRATLLSIGVGTVSWVVAIAFAWKFWPVGPPILGPGERLAYAATLLAGVATVFLLLIASCFRLFDTAGAEDPFAFLETPAWKVNQRVLSNTVEQGAVFVPALLALAVRIAPDHVRILPILTFLWCAGRLLFWIGYRIGPAWRGPGFEWTLYSSVTALGWFVSTL
jgi:hypothetical protein